ncbi:hypothetical protein EV589_5795 [Mycobacterium sp. BK558]|jgi:hypothetical protein|uniref:hypothetical protein n=1 Tax=Mycolicibacterium sp. CR10 TaxID=2562314 RepID=UPI00102D03ED|nr:hypothetical protein [Mycolicibacterium sp. CR10]RZT11598.1 hypothetical protein EV589_5795 [Mycobacterium sp. BK558]
MMTSAMGWGMMITGLTLLIGALTLVLLGAAWLTGAVGRPDYLGRQAPSAAAPTAVEGASSPGTPRR